MVRIHSTFALILLFSASLAPAAPPAPPPLTLEQASQRFGDAVTVLAADEMEGRGLGTAGIDHAAKWIEDRLQSLDLQPVFDGSYHQPFQVKTGVSLQEGNRLSGVAESDWTPLGFSSPGSFSGPLVFAGYGIEAPPIGYREMDGLDLKGKVVLMLRYEPQERDEASPFDGRKPSRWSAQRYKVHQARERGAAAVIFATGPIQDEGRDALPVLRNDGPESPAGIPVIQVKTSVAQAWLKQAGIDLAEFQNQVDRDLAPRSTPLEGLRIDGTVALTADYADTLNVAGMLPGRGPLAREILVVGAHYDHLGYGGQGSMRPNERAIHNGADDNASGVAAVLVAAERLRNQLSAVPSHRTIVFTLFSGEEVGLAGSAWFVGHSPIPLDKVVAMINLDMVGRLRDDKLAALGSDSAPEWHDALAEVAKGEGLELAMGGDGYGPSDQTSFYAAHIPVVHFFTGAHEQYHTPDDDAATLNDEGGAKIAFLTAALARKVALGELTPQYARAQTAPAMEGDSRGYGAYLGTIPDYSAMGETTGGVLLGDVRPGGPADLAGIEGGDRIIGMAGTKIDNLYDMTFALQDNKPGETIDVVVIRDGEQKTLRATLGSRPSQNSGPSAHATPKKDAEDETNPKPTEPPAAHPEPAQPPHPMAAAPSKGESKPAMDPWYANRPGKNFVIQAGKPFSKRFPGERHFADVRQLTFGGENAEAYFSPDGTRLSFQATTEPGSCDQQYVLDLATGKLTMVSSGKGRTTCGYFDYPEADRVIYASTETASPDCPPPADFSQGYVWAIYPGYELWEAAVDGSWRRPLVQSPGYDAEATWCHRGGKMVFTSTRNGDLDLYEMDEAGQVRQLTDTPGYDGGAFYSPDCSEIVWRASRPQGKELEDYRALLANGLIRPNELEIFVMNADGTNKRQITSNGAANFCPYFSPDGQRIIFASNVGSKDGREFDLWLVDKSGGDPERITTAEGFDGFPMWSPDGQWIVWGSNRADPDSHSTNLFIARWVE